VGEEMVEAEGRSSRIKMIRKEEEIHYRKGREEVVG